MLIFSLRLTQSAKPLFQIRGFETAYCIDSMGHTNGGFVELGPCHRMGGNQVRSLEASLKENCLPWMITGQFSVKPVHKKSLRCQLQR